MQVSVGGPSFLPQKGRGEGEEGEGGRGGEEGDAVQQSDSCHASDRKSGSLKKGQNPRGG